MAVWYRVFALTALHSALLQYEKILKLTSDAKLGEALLPQPQLGSLWTVIWQGMPSHSNRANPPSHPQSQET